MHAYRGSSSVVYSFLTSVLDGGQWSTPRPGCFSTGKEPNTPGRSGRLRRRGCLFSSPGFEFQFIQSVASLYTDCAIPTPEQLDILYIFPENKKKDFRVCSVDENCTLLGYYPASSGNFIPTFRFEFTTTNITDLYGQCLSLLTM